MPRRTVHTVSSRVRCAQPLHAEWDANTVLRARARAAEDRIITPRCMLRRRSGRASRIQYCPRGSLMGRGMNQPNAYNTTSFAIPRRHRLGGCLHAAEAGMLVGCSLPPVPLRRHARHTIPPRRHPYACDAHAQMLRASSVGASARGMPVDSQLVISSIFTPPFTPISSAHIQRAVNVSWLWCEQVAEPAVAAATGAQRVLRRCCHLSQASRGAETKARSATRRAADAAAIGCKPSPRAS